MAMEFSGPPRKERAESIIPMINVVFLLLIFFLMTSHLMPPEPFDVTPPKATLGTKAGDTGVLFLSGGGEAGFRELRGDTAIAAFVADNKDRDGLPQLRADGKTEATQVAALLKKLTEAGLGKVALVVSPQ